MGRFGELVAEAVAAPIVGWDFSWLDGRATEARPSWRFRERVAERAARARALLDIECGDGRLLDSLLHRPPLVVGVEDYQPRPGMLRATGAALPLCDASFDLVISRHPVAAHWDEIARVLTPGGTYFAQHVGPRSAAEVGEWFVGPWPPSEARSPERARREAERVGLDVVDLRYEELPMVFYDVGAVIYFLRLVVWIVPDFTVAKYRDRLAAMTFPFHATSTRFLIEAQRA
ncbi:MAG TPA: methyltransferase domain-containing protein [Acidimicrobiales bacterium]|nr:methyltransferase domain-containing protein [Acidimicrobiales bacterium]